MLLVTLILAKVLEIPVTSSKSYLLLAKPEGIYTRNGVQVNVLREMRLRDLDLIFCEVLKSVDGERKLTLKYPDEKRGKVYEESFVYFYRVILGAEELMDFSQIRRGGYLIIAPEIFHSNLQPLVDWLKEKGYTTWLVGYNQTGNTNTSIKNFIQNAYQNWSPKPEFVLLVGDVDIPGGYGLPTWYFGLDPTDLPYALLEGNDYLPDIWIGRLPLDTPQEVDIIVNKTINYEKNPFRAGENWLRRALMVASTRHAVSTKFVKMAIREYLLNIMNYAMVDTLFWYYQGPQPTPQDVIQILNEGVSIVNYRGWSGALGWFEPQFTTTHLQLLNNPWKNPVLYNVTCGVGNFASSVDPSFGELWLRLGPPSNPRGGVACFAPTNPDVNTRWNNSIDMGIFFGLVFENIRFFAPSGVRGLFQLFRDFPDSTGGTGNIDSIQFYFHVYQNLGVPSLEVRVAFPQDFEVIAPSSLPQRGGFFSLFVRTQSGVPVRGAYIALTHKTTRDLILGGVSDSNGFFVGQLSPLYGQDSIRLTITHPDFIPYQVMIPVHPSGFNLIVETINVSDHSGNFYPEPGENFTLSLRLQNLGNALSPSGLRVYLERVDTFSLFIGDSSAILPSIPPNSYHTVNFNLRASDYIIYGRDLRYVLKFYQNNNLLAQDGIFIQTRAPFLIVVAVNSSTQLRPGTVNQLTLDVKNIGNSPSPPLLLELNSGMSGGVTILNNSSSCESIPPGVVRTIQLPFVVAVSSDVAYGRDLWFRLNYRYNPQYTSYGPRGFTYFVSPAGGYSTNYPTGPCPYGYYAYDIYDTLSTHAPTFQWVELNPQYGGSGTPLYLGDDSTAILQLPFNFKYYGVFYNYLTVSSNGWVAFDSTNLSYFRNWPIPSPHGPNNLVAVFWDDINTSTGGIFYRYLQEQHRFIIQWDGRISGNLVRFQLHLLNPSHYPTPTGDGILVFNYKNIGMYDTLHYGATIGIEDFWHLRGLQYTYGNYYHPNSSPIHNNFSIKFTTQPPDNYTIPVQEEERKGFLVFIPSISRELALEVENNHRVELTFEVKVFDITGRELFSQSILVPKGKSTHIISATPKLTPGIYMVKIQRSWYKIVIVP